MITHRRACEIAGLKLETLRTVRKRYPQLFRSEWFSPGPEGIDTATVVFLAIYARLAAFGIPPQTAAEAAWTFTDFGDLDGAREPGRLYAEGRTYLLITPALARAVDGRDLTGGFRSSLVNLFPEQTVFEALSALGFPHITVASLVDLTQVVENVETELAKVRTPAEQRADEVADLERWIELHDA